MHPLTVFPALLTFGLFAPFILRVTVGVLRLFVGVERFKSQEKGSQAMSFLYIISSVLLIIGLYTQIAAIVAIFLIWFDYRMTKKQGLMTREKMALAIVMKIILISLLVTGPGAWAFDLPL